MSVFACGILSCFVANKSRDEALRCRDAYATGLVVAAAAAAAAPRSQQNGQSRGGEGGEGGEEEGRRRRRGEAGRRRFIRLPQRRKVAASVDRGESGLGGARGLGAMTQAPFS